MRARASSRSRRATSIRCRRRRAAGSRESDPLTPIGEYANSCVGRERVLEHVSRTRGTPIAIIRLNYAVDLRYGVLVDIAHRIASGEPVRLDMGYVNVIWQGDANAQAIRALRARRVTAVRRQRHRPGATCPCATTATRARPAARQPRRRSRGTKHPTRCSATHRSRNPRSEPPTRVDRHAHPVGRRAGSARGGTRLGKATKFEVRDGRY